MKKKTKENKAKRPPVGVGMCNTQCLRFCKWNLNTNREKNHMRRNEASEQMYF